jgi:hypothetical protein
MKKIVVVILLVLVTIYGYGMVTLSEGASNRFLNELENLSMTGKGEEYCARLHENLKVSIRDHSAEPPADFEGDREDFCGYVTYAMKGIEILGVSTNVTRKNFTVKRDWLHPWTVHVSYHEDRTTTMSKAGTTRYEVSDDRLTLVQTYGGVKLLSLESEVGVVPQPAGQ